MLIAYKRIVNAHFQQEIHELFEVLLSANVFDNLNDINEHRMV